MNTLKSLVLSLEYNGVLRTPAIRDAFLKVDRAFFVLPEHLDLAYEDIALPIRENQTISQPFTVAFMLELLQPKEDQQILDVGSGSGWTTALLAEIVGEKGKIIGIERIPALKEYGEKNVAKLLYNNVTFYAKNGVNGCSEQAPFDRILVSAAAKVIPPKLKEQLKIGGRLVMPLNDAYGNIVLVIRKSEDEYEENYYPGFMFVTFVTEEKNS